MSGLFKMARNRGLPIWLIFAYFIVFMLILLVLSIFRKNASGWSYANFKFLHTPYQKKIITLLFLSQIGGSLFHTTLNDPDIYS